MGQKNKDDICVNCPFYKAYDATKIYCEGIGKNTGLHIVFRTKAERQEYQAKHCKSQYQKCLVYIANDSKYDDFGELKKE